jgi:hypothetical protein
MAAYKLLGCVAVCSVIIAVAGCDKNPSGPTSPPASIQVSGTAPPTGVTSQFIAMAIAQNGVQTVVTAQASWLSSDPSIATVSGGVVRGIAPGTAEISATYSGVRGATSVTVSANPCAFNVYPADASLPGSGGQVTVLVNMTSGVECGWTATASPWLLFVGPSSGTGSGTFVVNAAFNPTPARVGTVTVAGSSVTVNQGAGECVISVGPAAQDVPDAGGSFTLHVNALDSCSWSVSGGAPFITVGHQVRSGTADVLYQVEANPSTNLRTATLTVDRFNIVITQSGPAAGNVR